MSICIEGMDLPKNAMCINVFIKEGKPYVTSITDSKKGHIPMNCEIRNYKDKSRIENR